MDALLHVLYIMCAQCESQFIFRGSDSCSCHIVADFNVSKAAVGWCDTTVEADRVALVVSDGPDVFLHAPSVNTVGLHVVFGCVWSFFFLYAFLQVCTWWHLYAVVSPSLKALLHAFKRFCTSVHPWFLVWQYLIFLFTVMFPIQILM